MEPDAFIVESEQFTSLRQINNRLFGDGTHLTPDQRRDLANWMWSVLDQIQRQPTEGRR